MLVGGFLPQNLFVVAFTPEAIDTAFFMPW